MALQDREVKSSVVCQAPGGTADSSALWESISAEVHRIPNRKRSFWRQFSRTIAFKFPRATDWIAEGYRAGLVAYVSAKPEIIISIYAPFEGHVAGYALAQKTGLPWIAFFSDPWPGHFQPHPYYRDPGFLGRILYRFWSRAIWSRADAVVFPSARLRDYMIRRHGVPRSGRCEILRHIAGTEPAVSPVRDRFRLVHTGQAGGISRPIGPLLGGIEIFLQRNPSARRETDLVFIGRLRTTKDDEDVLRRLSDVVKILETVAYSEACKLISEATVLILVEAHLSNGVYLPSKFADYIGTTLPVLCMSPREGEVADLLGKIDQTPISQTDPNAIAGEVGIRYSAWKTGELQERFSTAPLREEFQAEKVAKHFEDLCLQIIGRTGCH